MADPDHERVTCPACGKAYRWKESAVGMLVPCRKCGAEFTLPNAPGRGKPIEPHTDNEGSVYALALDLDEEPKPQRPPPPRPIAEPPPSVVTPEVPDTPAEPHEPTPLSEADKARRREEQRKAAATAPARSWRSYKLPIVLLVGAGLVIGSVLILLLVSDVLDGVLG